MFYFISNPELFKMQQWLTVSLGLCEILNQIMAVPALLTDAAEYVI